MKTGPLRVCHLGKYYPPAPGGIETHVRTLALAQAAQGADVHVVCVNHVGRNGKDLTWMRYGTTETLEEADGAVRVTRIGRSASFARLDLCPKLRSILRGLTRDTVDVLHLHTPNPTMLLALSIMRPEVPLVITHHSDVIKQRLLRHALRPFENIVYGMSAQIRATSPSYTSGSALLQRHEDRVSPLPLGVDLNDYLRPNAAAQKYAAALRAKHEPLWLVVGRCVYYKGLDTAIRALLHTRGTLLIIGSGPLEHTLKKLAKSLGVLDRIIWKRYASEDELVGAYHAATALWFPSNARSEAFGLVQVEAMASGCPVINTDIPGSGVPWVSPHMHTGLTVPVGDSLALADAANLLATDDALRSRLAAAARDRARAEFDHTTMAKRSLDGYRAAIAGQAAAEAETAFRPAAVAALPIRNGRPTTTAVLTDLADDDVLELAR